MKMLKIFVTCLCVSASAVAEDWSMGGRTRDRNPVSPEKGAPIDWQAETKRKPARNIKWSARLSGYAMGGPVVSRGLIWIGASNASMPLDPKITDDRGVLACFRESDGKFLYQYTIPRLEKYTEDWPHNGLSGSPIVEKDRLWFITNRREVVCLDIRPLQTGAGEPRELWKHDLIAEQKIVPVSPMIHTHNTLGSLAMHGDLLYVPTGNGVSVDHPAASTIKQPQAPAIVCLRKDTGQLVWKDNSTGKFGYGGSHASPLVVVSGSEVQVIHPQADGWVRSYEATTGKVLWQFDTNYKDGDWYWGKTDRDKSVVSASPVYADGRVYFAKGREHEFSSEHGRLFCIDPSKRGDVSPELADEKEPKGRGKPNPNSAVIWEYTTDGGKDMRLEETGAAVAVASGLAILPDVSGLVHCFDAKSGERYWTHVLKASVFGDPLIVDNKIFVGDENGTVTILQLAKEKQLLAICECNEWIVAPPVFANGVLYVETMHTLYAIKKLD